MSFLTRLRALLPINLGSSYVSQNTKGISNLTHNMSTEIATFASGCFWGTEHIFLKHYPIKEDKGILKTAVGYTGGKENVTNPSYRDVCSGETGHAEAVRIEFDPSKVSYAELVGTHDVVVGPLLASS
jgi:peptide-methionine (S)-S-oxide reductase